MMEAKKPEINEQQKKLNLAIAGLLSQVGLLTVGIIVVALVAGIFLDNHLGTKPWFTIGLLLVSIPVSLVAMVKISKNMAKKIQPEEKSKGEAKEENGLGN